MRKGWTEKAKVWEQAKVTNTKRDTSLEEGMLADAVGVRRYGTFGRKNRSRAKNVRFVMDERWLVQRTEKKGEIPDNTH